MAALLAATVPGPDLVERKALRAYRGAPPAVRAFLERRAQCNHWGGEEPYDAERAAEIAAAVHKLRCDRIEADERRIRQTLRGSPRLRWLIEVTRDWDSL